MANSFRLQLWYRFLPADRPLLITSSAAGAGRGRPNPWWAFRTFSRHAERVSRRPRSWEFSDRYRGEGRRNIQTLLATLKDRFLATLLEGYGGVKISKLWKVIKLRMRGEISSRVLIEVCGLILGSCWNEDIENERAFMDRNYYRILSRGAIGRPGTEETGLLQGIFMGLLHALYTHIRNNAC